jgi:hypothetical protein
MSKTDYDVVVVEQALWALRVRMNSRDAG